MNEVNAKAVSVFNGWEGHFRRVHKAGWEAVEVNGIAQIYETQFEAETMAWRALRSHLCSDIVGSGERASIAKAKLGVIFPGKNRRVVVERR